MVVCEGEKTEPDYLRLVNRSATGALVELVIIDDDSTSPKQLVDSACELKQQAKRAARRTRDPFAKIDEIWCVFDVDEHPMIVEARQRGLDNEVGVVVSNPSVELWFLLHFDDQTAWIHRDDARRKVEGCIAGYDKTLASLDPFEGTYEAARARAQHLTSKHHGDGTPFPEDNPSSNMWELVDSLQANY